MWCPSLSLVMVFILKSILSDMSIVMLTLFSFPFAWNIFFQPLTFSLYVSLGLRWVSCRQHIKGSCICIHLANMHLLVGAFSPKWLSYTHIYILFKYSYPLLFITGYWIQFPVLCIRNLLFTHCKCNCLNLPTLNSQSFRLSPVSCGNHKPNIYVYESVSVL